MTSLPTREALLGEVSSIEIECGDCGRKRWWTPAQIFKTGASKQTAISHLADKLVCQQCKGEGMPGKSITVQAAFYTDLSRLRGEAHVLKTQQVPEVELPDRRVSGRRR